LPAEFQGPEQVRGTTCNHVRVLNRSTLYVPIQPGNSTVQCISLVYSPWRVLVFSMVRQVPAKFLEVTLHTLGSLDPASFRLADCALFSSFIFITIQISFVVTHVFPHSYKTLGMSTSGASLCLAFLPFPLFSMICRLFPELPLRGVGLFASTPAQGSQGPGFVWTFQTCLFVPNRFAVCTPSSRHDTT
jgi:hypothetical protein